MNRLSNARSDSRCSAFTLIELLAVVAILLLLLSLLVPTLKRGRDMALDSRCKTNLRQMSSMTFLFAQDHEGVMPIGGSIGGEMGPLEWQSCWMGKEVLAGTKYENTTMPGGGSWPKNRQGVLAYGTLLPYLGNDVATAKRLYRCIAQPACADEDIGKGFLSNGFFDYAMVMAFSGATLSHIPTTARLKRNATTWEAMPTLMILEEDPYNWLNRAPNAEPGHGNNDKIGVWHSGHGNYASVSGSVNECRPINPVVDPQNPDLNQWFVVGPSGEEVKVGQYPGFGSWPGR